VLTSDIGGNAGAYDLDGVTLGTLYSSSETMANATGLTIGAADVLSFTITSGNETTTFTVDVDATDTIQDFIDSVGSSSGGRVTATYDDSTGIITYASQEDFTVTYEDGAGAGVDDDGFLDGTDGTGGTSFAQVVAPGAGNNSLTVSGFDFRLGTSGQALALMTASLDISTATGGETASNAIDDALTNLNKDMATLGAQAKALEVQKSFLGKLSDSIEAGIGNLVDADLAKESARLQALQVKQQLGAQALSIANSAPSIVLSFFR